MTTTSSPPRAVLTGVTVSFGLVAFAVDLLPAATSAKSKYVTVCPECTDATSVTQGYTCGHGHGPFPVGDCDKGRNLDGTLHKIDAETIAALQAEAVAVVSEKSAALAVFPAAQVEAVTYPSGSVYRLRPPTKPKATPATLETYALVAELASDPDVAFLTQVVIKGIVKLFRLVSHDGVLSLTEMVRPELVHPALLVNAKLNAAHVSMGRMLVEQSLATFDAADWADGRAGQFAQLDASLTSSATVTEIPKATPAETGDELLSLLTAAVTQAA